MSDEKKTVRYSDADLNEFKELIEKKLVVAKEDLEFHKGQMLDINEDSDAVKAGNFDEGSQNYEREHIAKMIQRTQDYIRNLEFALMRIQNKTYGVCSITGELIDKKRLYLVPHTTKSMDGKTIEAKNPPTPKADPLKPAIKVESPQSQIITKTIKKGGKPAKDDLFDDEEIDDLTAVDIALEDVDLSDSIVDE